MKNTKGFALVESLLILIILGLLVGTGWYVYNAHNNATDSLTNADAANSSVAAPAKKSTAPTAIPADWVSYSNTVNGFSFKYPSTWQIGLGNLYGGDTPKPDVSLADDICADPNCTLTVTMEGGTTEDLKTKAEASRQINLQDKHPNYDKTVTVLKEISIDANQAYTFNVTGSFAYGYDKDEGGTLVDRLTEIIFIKTSGGIARINLPANDPTYQTVLSSFKINS